MPAAPDGSVAPAEERLAERLAGLSATEHPVAVRLAPVLRRLGHYDRLVYRAVARTHTPALDEPLRRLSDLANFSKPWFAVAALLAVAGGPTGRRAALTGVAAIGAASLVVNQPMKQLGGRSRPDRVLHEVPRPRWVEMPTSTSFPSGHSASAAAFAVSVGDVVPALRVPLRIAAGTVAFSRVHTGVHYPGDVAVGVVTGALLGRLVSRVGARIGRAEVRV
ncbi:phosphatase PAP2 family protein [Fodinibacter luteus]